MSEHTLPSGAVLKITLSPFGVSKALLQALSKEFKTVKMDTDMEMLEVYKNVFCAGMASEEIEKALWKCIERCTYNDQKITPETFEPEQARQDFVPVLIEVTKENTAPFVKSLFAGLKTLTPSTKSSLQ